MDEPNISFQLVCERGDMAVLDHLLQIPEVDVTADENAAIRIASANGHISVVDRLLQVPQVDATACDNEAIQLASANGHLSVVDRLLAVPEVVATVGDSQALLFAVRHGRWAVVDRLLAVPGVDARDNRALIAAAEKGHTDVVDHLLCLPRLDSTAPDHSPHFTSFTRYLAVLTRLCATMPSLEVGPSLDTAKSQGAWQIVETLLSHPSAAVTLGLADASVLRCPITRHLHAIHLCSEHEKFLSNSSAGEAIRGAYSVAYEVMRQGEGGGLPVGVADLVCEYVAESRGLALWSVQVQRRLRSSLERLKQTAKMSVNSKKRMLAVSTTISAKKHRLAN
eukprot:TRINITY_DN5051_c0_g1_i1.p1 TRINITY_DN5051_c0_g1~~TRINITY_DN5051_c0_g1_i1.p1  ORF type:complete len:337 (+),score=17.90 TRINITY_DN5051_c0_g1_i1:20-1030(+)